MPQKPTSSSSVSLELLCGSIPALVTPLKDGMPDWERLEALVDWHVQQGSSGLVICGTTGESPTLSHDEHVRVVAKAVTFVRNRFPVIAGAGSNSTREAIDLSVALEAVGADALLHVTGYYNKPSNRQVIEHFRMLDECTTIPILVYDIPSRTGIELSVSTLQEISRNERIIGVKDSTGNVGKVTLERQTITKPFAYLSGDDLTSLGYIAHGGRGCISVTANVEPRLCAEMIRAAMQGDYLTARSIQDRLMPLHVALFLEPSPAGVKYAMSRRGLCSEEMRMPMSPVSDETRKAIDSAMEYVTMSPVEFGFAAPRHP